MTNSRLARLLCQAATGATALALATGAAGVGGVVDGVDGGTAGSFTGYLTVWIVCASTALVAAVLLLFVPRRAFSDRVTPADAPVRV